MVLYLDDLENRKNKSYFSPKLALVPEHHMAFLKDDRETDNKHNNRTDFFTFHSLWTTTNNNTRKPNDKI